MSAIAGRVTRPSMEEKVRLRVTSTFEVRRAQVVSFVLLVIAVLLAAVTKTGDGFAPRVDTIDALAGLALGAFAVDRLLPCVPVGGAA
jgi:hypothetical protein